VPAELAPIPIREILCPTDLSLHSEHALAHALQIARRFSAGLTLYHAVEMIDHGYAHWRFGHPTDVWHEAEMAGNQAVADRAATLDVPHQCLVERTGSVARAVLAVMQARQPDLTVMATHSRTGLPHFLLGSVVEKVVRHAFRPVLAVPPSDVVRPYTRIVLPTDFSLASRLAFPLAATLARAFGADVVALHVVAGMPRTMPVVFSEAGLRNFLMPEFSGLRVTPRVFDTGAVWHHIVETARLERADLIVMSTRGHHSLADTILGSNTDRVVRHAPCAVLVA
jgi:nucleotide-binding universal stress UspA family protein